MGERKKFFFSVIDIGSLATTMKIYMMPSRQNNVTPVEVESIRKYLPIGTDTYRTGILSSEQIADVCKILNDFVRKQNEYKLDHTICVATSAFREAQNRDFVIERIRISTGIPVTILDNSMERFYRNLYVKESLSDFSEICKSGTIILDIGAGSIQSTVYNESAVVFSQNMLLGSLRISDIYSKLERDSDKAGQILEEYISLALEDYHAIAPKGVNYKYLIVFGEETDFMKRLIGESASSCAKLTTAEFQRFYAKLQKMSVAELILNQNIPAPAAGLLLPSALLISKMLEYGGFDRIYLPEISLCDGLAYHYAVEKKRMEFSQDPSEDILSAARNMGKRYRYDRKHSERVRTIAIRIYDSLSKFHGLSQRERTLLEVTAILYEVGKHIQVSNYNRRSYHIIDTTEILGISREEQEIIAYAADFCNRPSLFEENDFQKQPYQKKLLISTITSILRLADALEASRRQRIQEIQVMVNKGKLQIQCEHVEDISYECWEFDNKKDLFYEVFGLMPVLKTRRTNV